jgi:hypothetical protein
MKSRLIPGRNRQFISSPASSDLLWSLAAHLFKLKPGPFLVECTDIVNLQFYVPLMVAQWLRYCATNRKVAVSIPGGVIGIFH